MLLADRQVAAGGGSILPWAVLAAWEAGLHVALEQEPPEDGEVERLRRELEAVTGEVAVAAAARFCSRTTGQPRHKSDLRKMD